MKATLNSVAVALLLCVLAYSANAQEKETRVRNNEGNFAVEFGLGGFGTFNVNGGPNSPFYSVSARKFISDNFALLAAVGFSSSSDLTDTTGSSNTGYSISVGVQKHWPLFSHNTSFYVQGAIGYGGGSMTSTGYEPPENINFNEQNAQAVTSSQTKSTYSGFSAGVGAGFDWYIWDGIALGASSGLYFGSSSSSEETSTETTDNPSSTSIGISTQSGVHMLIAF